MKLMIAVPCAEAMPARFVECLEALMARLRAEGVDFELRIKAQTLVYLAREALAAEAIGGGFTHILWLDSDMVFGPDVLDRLAAHHLPMVCGVYCSRRPPYRLCAFRSLVPVSVADISGGGVVEIAGCGFGCVLMEAGVIESVLSRCGSAFTPTRQFGEDLAFCVRVHDCGGRMYCDCGVRIGHIARIAVWPEEREELAALRG